MAFDVTPVDNGTMTWENVYEYRSDIKKVVIPGSVTSIGEGAFQICTSLSSITIHKNKGEISSEVDARDINDGTIIH